MSQRHQRLSSRCDVIPVLTVLVGRILHPVRPVAFVRDVGVCGGARGVGDAGFDVVVATLVEASCIYNEVSGHLPQDP